MAPRPGDKLLAAWSQPEVVTLADLTAEAEGVSRSEIVRAAVVDRAAARLLPPERKHKGWRHVLGRR